MNHQPYLFQNSRGLQLLLCSASGVSSVEFGASRVEFMPWKIHVSEGAAAAPVRVNTPAALEGFPVVIECNPTLSFSDLVGWQLSYVAGINKGRFAPVCYHFVTMPFDLETFTASPDPMQGYSVEPVFSGCIADGEPFTTSKDRTKLLRAGLPVEIPEAFAHLARVGNVFDSSELVLTVFDAGDYRSLVFALDTMTTRPLRNAAGAEIYKSSVCADRLAYAVKSGPGFEDRQIIIETIF